MSKKEKDNNITNEEESFETIELAVDDLEALARVFLMLDDFCQNVNQNENQDYEIDDFHIPSSALIN